MSIITSSLSRCNSSSSSSLGPRRGMAFSISVIASLQASILFLLFFCVHIQSDCLYLYFLAPGNILTVADDLLKNDGQKFLEMMEQLAERRMQREDSGYPEIEDASDDDQSEDDESDVGDDQDDDQDDLSDEEEEDDDDGDDGEEVRSSFIRPSIEPLPHVLLLSLSSRYYDYSSRCRRKRKRWKRASGCSPSSRRGCSSSVCCRRTARRSRRRDSSSSCGNSRMRTR